MSNNDNLANVLSQIDNGRRVGKSTIVTASSSTFIKQVLQLMQQEGYLGKIEEVQDSKGNHLSINLLAALNKCGVIKPRFAIKLDNFEKFEKSYLPARGFGIIIVSTSKGLMTHEKAKEQSIGGKLISYCY